MGKFVAILAMLGSVLVIALVFLAPQLTFDQPTLPTAPNIQNEQTSQMVLDGLPMVNHEVSLPALMHKEFDGGDLALGQVLAQTQNYTRYFITYRSGDLTISGIMNVPVAMPAGRQGDGAFPVLILNHGYIDPAIYTNGRGLMREQNYLANQGFVVIHPDYRNHAQSDKDPNAELNLRLGYAEDVLNLIVAVKSSDLEFLDKENIGMLGHSMGGGIAQSVMVAKPDLVKAFVLYAPVSSNAVDNFNKWTRERTEIAEQVIEIYGSPDENPKFWDEVSTRTYFDRVVAPVEIHHGSLDDSVPLEWSVRLEQELKNEGKQVVLHKYSGEGHEFGPQWTTFMQRSADFFNTYLVN